MCDKRGVFVCAVTVALLACGGPSIEPGSTLVVQVSGEYVEAMQPGLLSRLLADPGPPFVSLLSELRKAERDDRIANVVLRVRSLQIGWGQAQELRAAIERLVDAGRNPVAYLEAETISANLEYYVASAASQVHLSPAAAAGVTGLASEYMFLGGAWDKLGVKVDVFRVGKYKGATENIASDEMSDAYREMANALLDSIHSQFVAGIAKSRNLTPDAVEAVIDRAPMSPDELLRDELIDGVGSFDELIDSLGGTVVDSAEYAAVELADVGFDPVARFALIYGSGNVTTGKGRNTQTGAPVMASDTIVEALEEAEEDSNIDAIVLRLESPGGSPLAAEIMWHAVRRVDKPVIVSLANTAASGAYYVASAADSIVAPPASLTGSIGVFVLRPVIEDLLDDLGVVVESLTRGAHADMLLLSSEMSEGTRQRLQHELDSIYALFVSRVAEGRGLEPERVDALSGGRVYTGEQAFEVGLVDALGGLSEAVLLAKEAAGIDADADVALVPYPPAGSFTEQLAEALGQAAIRATPRLSLPGIAGRLQDLLLSAPLAGPALVSPFVIDIH